MSTRFWLNGLVVLVALAASLTMAEDTAWQTMMRADREGFAQADPEMAIEFPADHGPHNDFALEWWYLTANLEDQRGHRFGLQWTLFRNRLAANGGSGWQSPQIFLAHAALSDSDQHISDEKISRGGVGTAGVATAPFEAWIDDWRWIANGADPFPATLAFDVRGNPVRLTMRATGPYVRQGQQGYSIKNAAGTLASHYYSQPHVSISGQIGWRGETLTINGQGWFDREWSSQFLDGEQAGWDWFSLHLDDGDKLMLFQVRSADGHYRHGAWIDAEGNLETISGDAIQMQALKQQRIDGVDYPLQWRLSIDSRALDVTTTPLRNDSVMRLGLRYWEGAVDVSGSHSGQGFLEMTGY